MKKIWNIIIWVVAIYLILSSLYGLLFDLSDRDWSGVMAKLIIIALVGYGLYAKFWKKKKVKKEGEKESEKELVDWKK